MNEIKYFSEIKNDDLNIQNVFLCYNNEGFLCIFIKNSEQSHNVLIFNTDFLEFRLNTIQLVSDNSYYFHVIVSKNKDYYSKEQFKVIFEYLFSKIEKPISDNELSNLVTSLEEYFKISPEKDTRNLQIGVYGELLVIEKFMKNNYCGILRYYHKNFYSKHDLEISNKLRIEIKTTSSEKRIHNFEHNQLVRDDCEVYVCSSIIETCKEGYSLFELFNTVIKYFRDPDMIFSLRLMKKCNVDENNKGINVSIEKAINDIRLYNAKDIPHLVETIPDSIFNINYQVFLGNIPQVSFNDLIKVIKQYENN